MLLEFYATYDRISKMETILMHMTRNRIHPNVSGFNHYLNTLTRCWFPKDSLAFSFKQSQPTVDASRLRNDKQLVEHVTRVYQAMLTIGMQPNIVTHNLLMKLFSKCGQMDIVLDIFNEIRSSKHLQATSWTFTTLFSSLKQVGHEPHYAKLLETLSKEFLQGDKSVRTKHSYTALIDAYITCLPSKHTQVSVIYMLMCDEGIVGSVQSYATMMNHAFQQGDMKRVFWWLGRAEHHNKADVKLYANILSKVLKTYPLDHPVTEWTIHHAYKHTEPHLTSMLDALRLHHLIKQDKQEEAAQLVLSSNAVDLQGSNLVENIRLYIWYQELSQAVRLLRSHQHNPTLAQLPGQAYTLLIAEHGKRGNIVTALKLWKECIRGITSGHVATSTQLQKVTGALLLAMGKCSKSSFILTFWRNQCVPLFQRHPLPMPPQLSGTAITALGYTTDGHALRLFLRVYLGVNVQAGWNRVEPLLSTRLWSALIVAWCRCHEFEQVERMARIKGLDDSGWNELQVWERTSGIVLDPEVSQQLKPKVASQQPVDPPSLEHVLQEWQHAQLII